MDLLRNLFGNITSGLIRLGVMAGILALTYVFIVKPVLNTADEAIRTSNETFRQSFEAGGLNEINRTIRSVDVQVQRQIRRSFRQTRTGPGNPDRLIRCIKRSRGDVKRIERCTRRF